MKKINKWKFIARTVLLDHPRLKIVEDTVQLPDGTTTTYLRQSPSRHHSVAVLVFNDTSQLLLQREYSYPTGEILWQLPGGSMENQETPLEAALRELSEESGYTADDLKLIGHFFTNNRRSDEKQYVIVCSNLRSRKLRADPEEFISTHWIDLTDVQKMIKNGDIKNINLLAALQLFSQSELSPAAKELQ